jgi:hypothetical protein
VRATQPMNYTSVRGLPRPGVEKLTQILEPAITMPAGTEHLRERS